MTDVHLLGDVGGGEVDDHALALAHLVHWRGLHAL